MPLPLAALFAATASPAACPDHLCQAEALAPFAARLERLRPGSGETVHILQIGDSHTAGDLISGAWRRRLQARFGNGGRGVLAPGRPYRGYLTWDVTQTQSAGWRVAASFGPTFASSATLGLSGFTQTASAPGETIAVTADSLEHRFDRLVVCALAQPGGGSVRLRIGNAEAYWPLQAPSPRSECRTVDSSDAASTASLTIVEAGRVSVTSVGLFRREGGLVLSNLGVSGSQFAHFGRTDENVVAAELAAYRPDLIVLAFGTNEGFSPVLTGAGYETALRAQLTRLRRLAGDVPVLMLGPPNAAGRDLALASIECGGGWSVPALLDQIGERQATVASELGLAHWRWSDAMGGLCAASTWARQGLMRGDRVHFTRAGAERIAAMLDAALGRAVSGRR